MFACTHYLDFLFGFRCTDVMKLVWGVRRCGKTSLLMRYRDALVEEGVPSENFFYFDCERLAENGPVDPLALHTEISENAKKCSGTVYLLFDEVQFLPKWEQMTNSLRVGLDCDITLTSSDAKVLDGEDATYIAGRYVQRRMWPQTFSEFLDYRKSKGEDLSIEEGFRYYVRFGGMPGLFGADERQKDRELTDTLNTILMEDVVCRQPVRDIALLKRILRFIAHNIGGDFNAKTVADAIKSKGRKFSTDTVYKYMDWLEQAFVIEKVARTDIKQGYKMRTQEKIFFCDAGICNALAGNGVDVPEGILKNIVYLNLRAHAYDVTVGKFGNCDIDFVASNHKGKHYIQVHRTLLPEHLRKVADDLLKIKDNYPKTILTLSPMMNSGSVDGIEIRNLAEFLARLT